MKTLSKRIIKTVFYSLVILSVMIALIPFSLFDMKQAQRIARWKLIYEQLEYSFSLIKLHEGCIIPIESENKSKLSESEIITRISPYLNLESKEYISEKYKYRKMNGRFIPKTSQFVFNKFLKRKDGVYLAIKENQQEANINKPLYIMFVDINGSGKPNRVGKDIFFINIYNNKISALGDGNTPTVLKSSCSAIGGGFYCSEYYLLGGKF